MFTWVSDEVEKFSTRGWGAITTFNALLNLNIDLLALSIFFVPYNNNNNNYIWFVPHIFFNTNYLEILVLLFSIHSLL